MNVVEFQYFEGSKAEEGEEDRMEGAVSSAGDSDVQAEALRVKHFLQNPPATKSPVVLIDVNSFIYSITF